MKKNGNDAPTKKINLTPKKPDIRARVKERLEAFGFSAGSADGSNLKGSPSYRVEAVVSEMINSLSTTQNPIILPVVTKVNPTKPLKTEKEKLEDRVISSFASSFKKNNRVENLDQEHSNSLEMQSNHESAQEESMNEKPQLSNKAISRGNILRDEAKIASDHIAYGSDKMTKEDASPESPQAVNFNQRMRASAILPAKKQAEIAMSEKPDRLRTRGNQKRLPNGLQDLSGKDKTAKILEIARTILSTGDDASALKALKNLEFKNSKMSGSRHDLNNSNHANGGNNDQEQEAHSLRKRREPLSLINGNDSSKAQKENNRDEVLARKAAQFKKALLGSKDDTHSSMSVSQQAKLLHSLLKFLGTYHGIRMSELIEMLDESRGLNMELLRLRLCNRTSAQRVG